MRFPVAEGSHWSFPTDFVCPMCQSKRVGEPHEFVGLSGGAASEASDCAEGFLAIYLHPREGPPFGPDAVAGQAASETEGAELEIVRDTHVGQFDLYFCSTDCLRRFLNECVDELERSLRTPAG
jgi:hypothetical protein